MDPRQEDVDMDATSVAEARCIESRGEDELASAEVDAIMETLQEATHDAAREDCVAKALQHPLLLKHELHLDRETLLQPGCWALASLINKDAADSASLDHMLHNSPKPDRCRNHELFLRTYAAASLNEANTQYMQQADTSQTDIDCLGLGARRLGSATQPDLILSGCKIDGDVTVYGPTLCPIDQEVPKRHEDHCIL